MDTDTYEQLHVPADTVGNAADFLLENQEAIVAMHEGTPLYVELPASVELDHHVHRARPAGRPLDRRHEAGDARDRRTRSRCRCSSRPARRSRSTPATGATSAGSS